MKFLLIHYEAEILCLLKHRIETIYANLKVVTAIGIRDGLKLYALQNFNLLMIALPPDNANVHILLSSIRQATPIPIVLIMTFKDSREVARAYYAGADVCITDPIDIDIMVAVLAAQYKRLTQLNHMLDLKNLPMIICEDFIIYPSYRMVNIKDREIRLTAREFDLLYYFACNIGTVLTQDHIFRHIWKSEDLYNSRIDNRIYRLRKKIEPNPSKPTYIQTVYGIGYKFCT